MRSLVDDTLAFGRRFGPLVAVWAALLALAAPSVERPVVLVVGLLGLLAWSLAAMRIRAGWTLGIGWFVAACGAELLGPLAGTAGRSVAGGAAFVALALAALTRRPRLVAGVVGALSVVALVRPAIADGWTVAGSLTTVLIYVFGGLALAWLVRVLAAGEIERAALRRELEAVRIQQARTAERAEQAAHLHDSVLQTLTAIGRATTEQDAARLAARAATELRLFLRASRGTGSLRDLVEATAALAAAGRELSVTASGDVAAPDDRHHALVAAVGEAVRNAVAHTAGAVRVFVEVDRDAAVTAWVSDEGPGFALADVPGDRLGVRESIVGRLARAGGTAELRTGDTGTEWELRLPAASPRAT